jgi:hypothetical protein
MIPSDSTQQDSCRKLTHNFQWPDSRSVKPDYTKKDEAQKQFVLAAGLNLSAVDKAELARQMQGKV